jgi:hypothetical protein
MTKFLTYLFIFCGVVTQAQIHCGSVNFEPNTPVAANMIFDSFSQYDGGITINNVATLRLRIEDQAIPDPDCRWFLHMEVYNNPSAGTAPTAWETLGSYGSGASPVPTIDIMEIRVRNACQTSPVDGIFQAFNQDGDIIDIIADLLPLTPAGSCATNVNGPGDFQSDFGEYTFTIDIRVKPGYDFSPGIYELAVRFHLEEQM